MTKTKEHIPYMHPERFVPMPPEAAALLRLADILCGAACEICNQEEPAEPWGDTPMNRSPVRAFKRLSDALDEYYEARHKP